MDVFVTIKPAIMPLERGEIEDAVLEEMCEAVDITGGGTNLDGSSCNFDMEVFDDGYSRDRLLTQLRAVFAKFTFTQPTTITVRIGNDVYPLENA